MKRSKLIEFLLQQKCDDEDPEVHLMIPEDDPEEGVDDTAIYEPDVRASGIQIFIELGEFLESCGGDA